MSENETPKDEELKDEASTEESSESVDVGDDIQMNPITG